MQEDSNLIETLRKNNYYLMTNEEGNEVYNDEGKLLLYQAESSNILPVPNTPEVRRLYDLPLEIPEKKDIIKSDDVTKPPSLVYIPNEASRLVWMGQRNEHSMKATKMLIELFDSPRYQALMKNPNIVNQKVWEKIASELEENGFKIAGNTREAGLRAFQKWRNVVRTYSKFQNTKPDEGKEDKRRKKPYFFDDVHAVLSKRSKESSLESMDLYTGEAENENQEDDEDEELEELKRESELLKRKKNYLDPCGTDNEAFPRQALSLLTSLVTSPKYDEYFKESSQRQVSNKLKIWESIYLDMMKEGWKFGKNTDIRQGALIIAEKWRMVEKSILKKKLCGPRTLYTPTLRKAVLKEIEARKAKGPIYRSDSPSSLENPLGRKPKIGEIGPDAVKALLNIIGSGHYQNLFSTTLGKRAKIWEKIYDELRSKGFEIAGQTKRAKVTRVFQKWRNMKRAFVKYQTAKYKGVELKKPIFYEAIFEIVSKDILNLYGDKDGDSDEEVGVDEWDEDSDADDPHELVEIAHVDHNYGHPSPSDTAASSGNLPKIQVDQENSSGEPSEKRPIQPLLQSNPSTSRTSRSYEILEQIKSLHETSLAMQQQNFSRIISLLENQISQQNQLTTVISQYVMSQGSRTKSKNGHSNEQRTSSSLTDINSKL